MAPRTPPDGFASTALVALVFRALAAERPELLPQNATAPDPMKGAVTAAGDKRGLLEEILAKAGAGPLLAVGQYLERADEVPTLRTLVASPDAAVLAEKWMRLERYHHASNRTRIIVSDHGFTCVRHGETSPPVPAENALIAGFIAGLCARAGATGVTIAIEGRCFDAAALTMRSDIAIRSCERFNIGWRDWPVAGTAPLADDSGRPSRERLGALLAADIGRGWRLTDAAPMLAMSVRSLQRQLTREGRSFSGVLRQQRVNAAGALLGETEAALAEIGYCCGYADQAHFQRDFRRALNITPQQFRLIARAG